MYECTECNNVVITKYENTAFKYKRSGAEFSSKYKGAHILYWFRELSVKLRYLSNPIIRDTIVSCWLRS